MKAFARTRSEFEITALVILTHFEAAARFHGTQDANDTRLSTSPLHALGHKVFFANRRLDVLDGYLLLFGKLLYLANHFKAKLIGEVFLIVYQANARRQ